MTEQAATGWFWTVMYGGAIYLVAGWFVYRWLGPAIGLGGSEDPRNERGR